MVIAVRFTSYSIPRKGKAMHIHDKCLLLMRVLFLDTLCLIEYEVLSALAYVVMLIAITRMNQLVLFSCVFFLFPA